MRWNTIRYVCMYVCMYRKLVCTYEPFMSDVVIAHAGPDISEPVRPRSRNTPVTGHVCVQDLGLLLAHDGWRYIPPVSCF